jgi:hypothetical protein
MTLKYDNVMKISENKTLQKTLGTKPTLARQTIVGY